ncbi:flagellin [Agrobacterium vitis]|uniref:Flagellin n=1 Tax=Agrobacterium vitis TaxID=373 RepID=A0AAE5AWP9_AGRVI|nr:flagellin [Agrobacterium vitis]MCF1499550.1 flagellin [Allorhizobium sp. Av2]MCM2440617.1 flagellin [Agrobacterium vitis]MUO81902.1 flagellin [Agrobacterium vitis]MUO97698.1 flagellin [Agrobacterium vitis]MUP07929.1 flagellin [Agrobacterium vitis]
MTSIMTNTSAMAALQTLRGIDQNMETTQNRISSGYKVDSAKDNAAYWSIATTMRSDNKALSTVQDALGLAASKADTAYTGLDSSIDVLSSIKSKLVAAREPGVDKDKINQEINELKNQLASIAESASFSGENWLYNESTNPPTTKEMVASFNRASDGTVSVTTLKFNTSESTLIDTQNAENGILTRTTTATWAYGTTTTTGTYYLLDADSVTPATGTEITLTTDMSNDDLDGMISAVDKMLQDLTDSASTLGAISSRIESQDTFVKNLSDTIDKGVGRLVDADMNEESTKIKALQTQQQLGIQALSIANTNAENILTLFK